MATGTELPIVNIVELEEVGTCYEGERPGSRGISRSPDKVLGLQAFGISFDTVGPGQENAKYHIEHDEEELFYVLAGTCKVRLDGKIYALQSGDVLYTPTGVAHSFFNDGVEPCEIWMIGQTVKGARFEYPPAPVGPVQAGRPPRCVNLAELQPVPVQYDGEPTGLRGQSLEISAALGVQGLFANLHLLAPGQQDSRYHYHRFEEEFFYVMAGSPTLKLGEQEVATQLGDCIYIPTGTAHCFRNDTDQPALIWMLNTVCGQPDSHYPDEPA